MYKEVDISNLKRRAAYECFINYDNPIFSLQTRLDVTKLVKYSKKTKSSFFANMLYLVAKAVNNIEEFKYRLKDKKLIAYDTIDASFVVKGVDDIILTRQVEFNDYAKFYLDTRKMIDDAKKSTALEEFSNRNRNDVFYVSTTPWLDFTSMSNPYDVKNEYISSIPRITWGKFVKKGFKYYMSVDIACHHALIDGYQVSTAFSLIQSYIYDIKTILK